MRAMNQIFSIFRAVVKICLILYAMELIAFFFASILLLEHVVKTMF